MARHPELWSWLGEPLPVDFANTVRREGSGYRELLGTGGDVAGWASHQTGRLPQIEPDEAEPRLDEIRATRDDVFAVLAAAAEGRAFPEPEAGRLNDRVRARPLIPQLGATPGETATVLVKALAPVDEVLARVAHATITLASAGGAGGLGFCDAPSCGQFFMRDRPNQHWCGPACGTRARVARHAGQRVQPYRPPAPPSAAA
jgi:hypothetical protein